MTTSTSTVSEYDAIAETVRRYVDGGRSGRSGDDLFGGPIQKLFDWNDQNGPATGLQARVASIDLIGTVATARLELDNWTGHKFTDMFTLLKTDGEWKIISKVFYLHPES
jgi:hypothetical protein